MRLTRSLLLMGSAAGLVLAGPAFAQVAPSEMSQSELQQEVADLRARDRESQARIEALELRLEALEDLLMLPEYAQPVSSEAQARMRGRGVGTFPPQRDTAFDLAQAGSGEPVEPLVDAVDSEDEEVRKSAAPSDAVEAVTRSEQGYFGDRLGFELGLNYAHFDDAQINLSGFLALDAIFLGLISIDETTADVLTADFSARYGITDRLQIDVNVPYLVRHSNFKSAGAGGAASGFAEWDVSDHGLGDINGGISYRLFQETYNQPDVVVHIRGKAPTGRHPFGVELFEVPDTLGNLAVPTQLSTGSGVWAISSGVSVLKTLDPMIIFGSMTHFYNFGRNFDDISEAPGDQPGRAKLGNAIQVGAGVAFALNERSSLSASFTERFVAHTKLQRVGQERQSIVGSQANVGILNLGASFALTQRMALLATVGIGMTRDAPNMILNLRVPFRF